MYYQETDYSPYRRLKRDSSHHPTNDGIHPTASRPRGLTTQIELTPPWVLQRPIAFAEAIQATMPHIVGAITTGFKEVGP